MKITLNPGEQLSVAFADSKAVRHVDLLFTQHGSIEVRDVADNTREILFSEDGPEFKEDEEAQIRVTRSRKVKTPERPRQTSAWEHAPALNKADSERLMRVV